MIRIASLTLLLVAGCGASGEDLIQSTTTRFASVGHPRVAMHERYRVQRDVVEACFTGRYRWDRSTGEACFVLANTVANTDPAAGATLALASCEADLPDERACELGFVLLRGLGDASRLSEMRRQDVERAASLCETHHVHAACSALRDWNAAIGLGQTPQVAALSLRGSAELTERYARLAEETRATQEVRLANAREETERERASWEAELRRQARQRRANERAAVAGLAILASGLSAVSQAARGQTPPPPTIGPRVSASEDPGPPTLGGRCLDSGQSCRLDPRVQAMRRECEAPGSPGQRACYCAAAFTAMCLEEHGCYRGAAASETSVTLEDLRRIQSENDQHALELGQSCRGVLNPSLNRPQPPAPPPPTRDRPREDDEPPNACGSLYGAQCSTSDGSPGRWGVGCATNPGPCSCMTAGCAE